MSFLDVPGVKAGALDASIQAKIEDTGSATRGALNATYATPATVTAATAPKLDIAAGIPLPPRTNLDTNPSFETATTGWAANGTGNTIATSTAQAYVGTKSMLITWGSVYGNAYKSFTAAFGLTYTWSMWVFVPAGNAPVLLTAYGAMAAQVYSAASTVTGAWQRLSVTFTATGTGVTLAVQGVTQPPAGNICYVDAGLIEQTAALKTYFDGSTAASGDTSYAWSGSANASTSTQTTAGSVASASFGDKPAAYLGAKATAPYDPRLNVFNWKQSNTRKLHAALGRAKSATGIAKLGFAGDSTTAGYTALAATQSAPIVIRDMLEKQGYPIKGTGPTVGNPGGGPGGFLDGRWVYGNGTWTTQAGNNNFLYQTTTSGATATFTSDKIGSIVEVRYMNNGGAFTISVDGASSGAGYQVVTPSGASTMTSATLPGLANTTHTVVITTTSTNAYYNVWADVRQTTGGVLIANFGVCSSTTANWIDGNFYFPGNVLVAWAPDCTFLDLGINDVGAAMSTATIKANLQTLITMFKATGDVILVTSNPHESLDFAAVNKAKYELAISNDIPLIDIHDRFTSYAISNPLGMYSDAAHPNAAGYADKGSTLFRALA